MLEIKALLMTLLLLHVSPMLMTSLHVPLTDLLLDSKSFVPTCMATAS